MLMVHSYIKGVLFYLITLYTYYDSDYNNHFGYALAKYLPITVGKIKVKSNGIN